MPRGDRSPQSSKTEIRHLRPPKRSADLLMGDDCLQVRGCHSTVWPTELPPWTPLPIMKMMVKRYRGLVRDALEKMMRAAVASSLHTPKPSSSMSDSGLASNSSSSSDDDDIEKAILWFSTKFKETPIDQ